MLKQFKAEHPDLTFDPVSEKITQPYFLSLDRDVKLNTNAKPLKVGKIKWKERSESTYEKFNDEEIEKIKDYLEETLKIMIDDEGIVSYIWNPDLLERIKDMPEIKV